MHDAGLGPWFRWRPRANCSSHMIVWSIRENEGCVVHYMGCNIWCYACVGSDLAGAHLEVFGKQNESGSWNGLQIQLISLRLSIPNLLSAVAFLHPQLQRCVIALPFWQDPLVKYGFFQHGCMGRQNAFWLGDFTHYQILDCVSVMAFLRGVADPS